MGHVVPVVALLAGHPDLLDTLDKAIRVTQNHALAAGMLTGHIIDANTA